MRRVLIIVLIPALCGCSFDAKWTDVTGQKRTESAAQADDRRCQRDADYSSDGDSRAEYQLAAERFRNCMSEHGWKKDQS